MTSTDLLFPPPTATVLEIDGAACFPVHRVFCVGRNYADHIREVGGEMNRETPFFFIKPAAMVISGARIPYPPGTSNFHYEVELVAAIGAPAFRIAAETALDVVIAYGCGLDMTRRDLQRAAGAKQLPWDFGKNFENSAVIAPMVGNARFGRVTDQRIELRQNGELRQQGRLSDMIWNVAELVACLSQFYHLGPGDLLYTGTPAGVGPVAAGDRIVGTIDGLPPVELHIINAE
jgi:fumarylpyruvate hydrolase